MVTFGLRFLRVIKGTLISLHVTLYIIVSSSPAWAETTSQHDIPFPVSDRYEEEGQVLVLKRENLEQAIEEFRLLMVDFTCILNSECRLLEPEFALTAEVSKVDLPEVRFAKMDAAEVEPKLMNRFRISTDQPTVILFRDGQAVKYDQALRASNMAAWLRRKTGKTVMEVKDKDTLDRIIRNEVIIVVGLFKGGGRSEPLTYLRVAEEMQTEEPRIRFLVSESARLFSYLNISSDSAIVILKKFDDGRANLTENLTKDRIRKFLKTGIIPSLVLFTKATSSFIRHHEIENRLLFFVSVLKDDSFIQAAEAFSMASKLFRNKVLFVVLNVDESESRKELEQFGSEADCPLLTFVGLKLRRLPNASLLTKEKIQRFVREVLDGREDSQVPESLTKEPKTEL